MIALKVNGNKIRIPGCKEEVSTGIYQRIIRDWSEQLKLSPEKRDYFKLFSIMAGIEPKGFDLPLDKQVTLENAIRWFIDDPFSLSNEVPKVLSVGKKIIVIPKDIGALGIGQNIFMRQQIEKSKYLEENISIAVATYLQPTFSGGKFDIDKVMELDKIIQEIPVYLTYPIGFFLVNRAIKCGPTHESRWRRILSSLILSAKGFVPKWRRFTSSAHTMIFH